MVVVTLKIKSKFSLRVAGVSVAEFITVRFQRSVPLDRDLGLSVSVAEFITVRFQPETKVDGACDDFSFSS